MKIIFVKDHIIDDEYGIKVHAGRTGVLLDESTGLIELDDPDVNLLNHEVVYGTIDGVQSGFFIPKRDDVD